MDCFKKPTVVFNPISIVHNYYGKSIVHNYHGKSIFQNIYKWI